MQSELWQYRDNPPGPHDSLFTLDESIAPFSLHHSLIDLQFRPNRIEHFEMAARLTLNSLHPGAAQSRF